MSRVLPDMLSGSNFVPHTAPRLQATAVGVGVIRTERTANAKGDPKAAMHNQVFLFASLESAIN